MINVFFRNDDVRESLDDSLIKLIRLFIEKKIPISLAVEPSNISLEVVKWINNEKKTNEHLIEIIQHGYNHNQDGKYFKQEFGGNRSFEDQFLDIRKGEALMNQYFSNSWLRVFSFPYGTYNKFTMQALSNLKYVGVTTGISYKFKTRIKNIIGRTLKRETLFGKGVSYHMKFRPSGLKDVSTSISIIKKYYSENECEHFSLEQIINNIEKASKFTNDVGILLHHRFHEKEMQLIEGIIDYIQDNKMFKIKSLGSYYE